MPTDRISLDEASWRLEKCGISGAVFAELLYKSEPLLSGLFPGQRVPDPIDLSRLTSFRAQPENVVAAGDVTWTDVKISWRQLCAAFEKRGLRVSWNWHSDITTEMVERSRQPDPTRRLLTDLRPPPSLKLPTPAVPRPERRASPEWFAGAVYTGLIPASGKAPLGKRGPRSLKRENTAAAIRKDLADKTLTVASLRTMREKVLAGRYQVSRDTARKARQDALDVGRVDVSTSTNDK